MRLMPLRRLGARERDANDARRMDLHSDPAIMGAPVQCLCVRWFAGSKAQWFCLPPDG